MDLTITNLHGNIKNIIFLMNKMCVWHLFRGLNVKDDIKVIL
jgi:hypothetical protein